MISGAYRDFFAAAAGSSGALTGLLFVAMSVAPPQGRSGGPPLIREIRASAALLAFTNALAVSLFALVPTTRIGYPAIIFGIIGIAFTAAAVRSMTRGTDPGRVLRGQFGLLWLLLAIYTAELVAGIAALADPRSGTAVQIIGYALVASLLLGIGRAWEFIGERDTGLGASLSILLGRRTEAGGDPVPPADDQPGGPDRTG